MNVSSFCGRIVADAEMRTTKSGTTVCHFRLASDSGFGEHKQTHFLGCSILGERGQKLKQYLKKGDPVTVIGSLSPPRLYDAQGEKRVAQDMKVLEIEFQSSPRSDSNGATARSTHTPQPSYQSASQAPQSTHNANYDDDIPF